MDCFTTWSHLSQQLELDPSHLVLLCGRVFGNKACLIRKAKKQRAKRLNEPENVMHLPKLLWWESIDSDMNVGFMWPFMYAVLRMKEHGPVLLHELTLLQRSPETCLTFSLPPRSLSLLLLCCGVCWMPDFSLTRWSHYPWQFKSDRHWQVKDYQTMQCRKALR